MVKDRNTLSGNEEPLRAPGVTLPYPVTPASPRPRSQASDGYFDHSIGNLQAPKGSHSITNDPDSDEKTVSLASETTKPPNTGDVPEALRAGKRKSAEWPAKDDGIPTTLRVGRPSGVPDHISSNPPSGIAQPILQTPETFAAPSGATSHPQRSDNPHIRPQDSRADGINNSYINNASIWQQRQTAGTQVSPHQTALSNSQDQNLVQQTSNLSLGDPSQPRTRLQEPSNLYGPHESTPAVSLTTASPPTSNVHPEPSYQAPAVDRPRHGRESVTSIASNGTGRSDSSAGWDPGADITSFDAVTSRGHGLPGVSEDDELQLPHRTWEEQQAWESAERERRQIEAAEAAARAQREERERLAEEEWFKGEQDALTHAESVPPLGGPALEAHISNTSRAQMGSRSKNNQPPPLPPRKSNEEFEPGPDRQQQMGSSTDIPSSPLPTETAAKKIRKQKKEVYQIKIVNWADASSSSRKTRKSPVLIQNLNGPCPLLALVNALTLSTPADLSTPLIETLRSREQVTLGLLLDAVFDELMSGRRGDAAQELPNISDLYAFLVTLHTGMNVNPRFIRRTRNTIETSESLIQASFLADPSLNPDKQPGSFEDTRELKLYSTFSVPLIHGWLPQSNERAHAALERSAVTYEDAQNLMFREEELEEKVRGVGINEDERVLLEDISTVQTFLRSSATQLTPYGLDIIQSSMKAGSIAILFRNDHFSTLYKHPQSGQLLQLVTDAGYAGHDEIVWESLVDVNGERCEFFAGDFRPVGNNAGDTRSSRPQGRSDGSLLDDDEGWTTVERSSGRGAQRRSAAEPLSINPNIESQAAAPFSPSTEQEDHDLALALQLQEEEEDRDRRENEARRREEDLSRTYLSSQATSSSPPTPRGRRSSNRQRTQEVRPLVPLRQARPTNRASNIDDGADAPPPSYEQAANGPPYIPPEGHVAHSASPPVGGPTRPPMSSSTSRTSQQSAYAQTASQFVLPPAQQYQGISGRGRANRRASGLRSQAQGMLNEVQGTAGPHGGRPRRDEYVQPPAEEKCTVM